jgi:DNA-binding MarR family transcriptional regulator
MEYNETVKYFSYSDADQDLWMFLTRTRYAIYRAREKELQRYGVTPEQVGLLFIVQSLENRATPAEIARHINRQPHTASALIDRMEGIGLVKKTRDLEKKNMVRVSLTEKGQKAYELSIKRGPIHRIMSVLNKDEKILLRKILENLNNQARQELGLDRDKLPSSEYDLNHIAQQGL